MSGVKRTRQDDIPSIHSQTTTTTTTTVTDSSSPKIEPSSSTAVVGNVEEEYSW
jgi:hypothetical protein